MTQRVWQGLAVVLAIVLIAVGAFAAFIFVQRTANQPRATPTPRPSVTPSPLPTGSGLATSSPVGGSPGTSASPSGGASPSGSAPVSGEPSPSDSPTPSASLEPTPRGTVTDLRYTFENMALDDPDDAAAKPYTFTFFSDGPGSVRAQLSGTTGGVARICLHRGSPTAVLTTPLCFDGRNGFVRQPTVGQHRQWTVMVSGRTAGRGPVTDLIVDLRGRESRITVAGYRFSSTGDGPAPGLVARFKPRASGPLFVDATFEGADGEPADHRLLITDLDTGSVVVDESATGTSLDWTAGVERGNDHRLELRNTSAESSADLRLEATLVWP